MGNLPAVLLALGYPLLVYGSIGRVEPRYLALALLGVLLLRWRSPGAAGFGGGALAAAGGLLLLAAGLANDAQWLLVYPVLVSATFFTLFAYSLVHPPTVVERLARLREPDLPPRGVAYTRKVTLAWCGFFLGNGLIAAGTVWYGDLALWGIYNGLIAYVLMGVLMAGELWVRKRVRKSF